MHFMHKSTRIQLIIVTVIINNFCYIHICNADLIYPESKKEKKRLRVKREDIFEIIVDILLRFSSYAIELFLWL